MEAHLCWLCSSDTHIYAHLWVHLYRSSRHSSTLRGAIHAAPSRLWEADLFLKWRLIAMDYSIGRSAFCIFYQLPMPNTIYKYFSKSSSMRRSAECMGSMLVAIDLRSIAFSGHCCKYLLAFKQRLKNLHTSYGEQRAPFLFNWDSQE